jgi:molybdate transport system substrate-binding protein
MRARRILAVAAAFWALVSTQIADAQVPRTETAGLKVLASNGMKSVIDALEPELERAVGRPLDFDFSTTAAQRQKIEGGAAFDAAILATEAVQALAGAGKVAPDSVTALAQSGIAIGVRAGAPKPDVSSPEALKRMLLAAKSVTWVGVGAARPHIEKMLATLDIGSAVQQKFVPAESVDGSLANVTEGRAEVVLILASEISHSAQVAKVGLLPAQVQGYVTFSSGAASASGAKADVAKLVAALRARATAGTYEANGMELAR